MMTPLTPRQKQILDFIVGYIDDNGYPPTIRAIGHELCIRSTSGVTDHLKSIERKGYIARDYNTSRAIRVLVTSDRSRPKTWIVRTRNGVLLKQVSFVATDPAISASF
jgi:repressor LexA